MARARRNTKLKWCDRMLTNCAYYYCLCITEQQFYAELKRLELHPRDWPRFVGENGHATTHTFTSDSGKQIAIVSLGDSWPRHTGVQVAALLVHEAVHIWQHHARYIGTHNDHGDEEEAYAIQNIAQELMESFVEQTKELYGPRRAKG